ncbi:choice-of-anchor I family protein [Candidatus Thalassolituus haligoni]|uniref:choice-of-anchor I family protein n=1 Tax=Candidatus Thalassolituus haligoni TaxID=3100113 RepID=UPI0035162B5C
MSLDLWKKGTLAMAITAALTACGSDDNDNNNSADTNTDTPAEFDISNIVINEVRSTGDYDYVEIYNAGSESYTFADGEWGLLDGDSTHTAIAIPAGTEIAAGGYLLVLTDATELPATVASAVLGGVDGFGLGKGDTANLLYQGTAHDSYSWTDGEHADTLGRYPDGGDWAEGAMSATPAAANTAPAAAEEEEPVTAVATDILINEVRTKGDFDFVELYNSADAEFTFSGTDWTLLDSDDGHTPVTIPDGTVIAAKGFLVIMPNETTQVDGAPAAIVAAADQDFGLGKGDTIRLFYQGNLADEYTVTADTHANSAGRLPDGGDWATGDIYATPGETNLAASPAELAVTTLFFDGLNDQEAALEAEGFRVFGPAADLATDVEPEYVAISADDTTAWVSLQENNGLAVIDLTVDAEAITKILPLGLQDYGLEANAMNASDKEAGTALTAYANVKGFFMPDAITTFEDNGTHYVISANEGDARDYDGFSEEARVDDLTLNTTAFPDAATLQGETVLGRLKTTLNPFSDEAVATDIETIYAYGGRSFSIWNGETGEQVFDSGNDLAEMTIAAGIYPDGRSDDKGSEPESVTTGMVNGLRYAFIGMERASAIAVYDISDISAPEQLQLLTHEGDEAPEGLLFLDSDSVSEFGFAAALVTANEVSGTLSLYAVPAVAAADSAKPVFSHQYTVTIEGGERASEIVAYDSTLHKLYVVNNGAISDGPRVDIVTLSDTGLAVTGAINLAAYGAGVNSVAVKNGKLAVAMEANDKQAFGTVAVFNTSDDSIYGYARVGSLPDMVTFSHDGSFIMTANEGEPNSAYTRDPKGSVSVIRLN